jgi:HSP20 family protein
MNRYDFLGVNFDDLKREFKDFADNFKGFAAENCGNDYRQDFGWKFGDRDARFSELWYPRTNTFVTQDGSLVYEFMLPGFDEKSVSLGFKGDKMVLRARLPEGGQKREGLRHERRGFTLRDIDYREYSVPADRYDQAAVKAVYRNGILTVTIPALDVTEAEGGVKIEIVKEGN